MLYDAVEKVKTLVVIGLRGNKLLENSKQARLRGKEDKRPKCQHTGHIMDKIKQSISVQNKTNGDTITVINGRPLKHRHHLLSYLQQSRQ